MRRRTLQAMMAGFCLLLCLLSACGSGGGGSNGGTVTLTLETNVTDAEAQAIETLTQKFTQLHPTIKVDVTAPGADYENIMKVKMASKHLPDIFSTHGWAKIRYGNFLADLRDRPWASHLSPTIKDNITDSSGKVYVLPIDEDKSGLMFNSDVLKQYGIAIPETYDELVTACQTINEKSHGQVTPMHIGGADSWPLGNYFDYFSTSLLISPQKNYTTDLLNGTFDWSHYTPLAQDFLDLQKKGCLNKDVLTAKYSDSAQALAQGKAAFGFYGSYIVDEAKKVNPNVHLGLMPIPAMVAGDQPSFAGGERTTLGIWKDSPHLQEAKQLLDFMAQPENIKYLAKTGEAPAGLQGIQVDLGEMTQYYQKYSSTPVYPYFDRVYLPNGMWDPLCKNAQNMLAGAITPSQYSANLKQEYDRLKGSH
ncbi:putative binding protein MsmE [Ktedonobacter sp. SOSP1-85]|nr:putative binding protein MsmE [Ktedonobacter sp. SOSP1-85]